MRWMARSSTGAEAVQASCDRCNAPLVKDASYCDECGQRTQVAIRRVRLAVRIEILFFGAIALMVLAFAVSQIPR
jgi:predicted nucleic acid-binding Zn ribbon protein